MTDTISEAPTPELFKGDNEKDVGIPPRSASIVSKSSKKKRNKRKRARQWTYYIDTLKGTIDCLYEMCRSEHSVAGCREAVLYLQNASNDFKALIDTINVEVEWNQTSLKKQSVAWEIRKSMSSPNPHAINDKLAGTSTSLLPISMLAEAVRNANAIESGSMSDSSNFGPSPSTKISYAQITAAAESFIVAAVAAEQQHYQNQLEDGWQVVRGRRRKSASSTTVSEYDREMSLESDQTPIAPLNVYERLSSRIGSAVCRRGNYSNSSTSQRSSRAENSLSSAPSNSRLTCPRSAMDLPQTKASMAKMAYSRQLLWERSQQLLVEKLRARQKKDKLALSHPPHAAIASSGVASSAVAGAVSETTSTASRPARPSTCGFTFADPLAVRKSVEEYTQQKRKRMQQQQQKMISTSSEHVDHSLQSINEDASETIATADMTVSVVSEDAVPADPKPMSPVQKDKEPTPPGRNSRSEPMTTSQTLLAAKPAGSSTSAPPSVDVDDDVSALVEDDVVWREMTEEEESLALEENSLKFEIEKAESISIDAELEQQVTVEADQLERAERKEKRRSQRAKDEESKAASSSQDYQKFYQAFRAELHTLATVAWSELMSHQMPLGPVHEPGTPVERHEKMNSPSRRKCEKDDDDFGRRHEEKLRRADELRLQLQEERATRVKELTHRVEEVRAKQAAIKERKRQLLEHRMQRAIENRETHITEIIRKAKDDDQKVLEIQFINTLQEEGKRHDLMVKDACMEEKRKQMADGRARKLEEKATKEAAAVSRRRQAEIARHSRLQEMADRKEARSLQRASEQEEKKRIQKDKMTTPMKVASCASTPTQKEKEQKHADEAAEEFKADVAKADESTEAAEEEPVDVWRRFVERRRVLLDLEDKWTKVDDAKFWPSDDALKTARACKKCDEKMQSELQVMAHIVSDKHLEGADLLKTKCESQDLRNEEMSMIDTDELVVAAVADDVDVDKEDRLSQVVGRIIDLQSRDSVPTTVTMSPRTRLRQVNGLTSLLDKAAVMKTIDDGIQKSLETTLCELVAGYDEEERKGTTMFADQLVASGGIQKTCNALLEWIQRGASLRLCLRYAHLLCTFLPNPRVAYTILYKPQLQRMLETIVRLVATSPTSPQLAALLDVVKALLTSVSSRIVAPNAKEAKRWKELKPLDEGASEAMSAVAEYLRCSLSATTILGAIKAVGVGGIALTMRLHGVLLAMSPCDLGEKLYIEFMDAVMSHAFGLYKQLGETADQRQERTARDFSAAVFRCLGELRGKHNHELMWTMLLTDARRALIVRLLFSNYLKHAIGADSSAADGALAQCLSILTDFAASGVGRQLLLHLGWKRSSAAAQLAAVSPRWVVVPSLAEPLMTCLAALTRDFQPAAKIVDLCPLQATALLRFVEMVDQGKGAMAVRLVFKMATYMSEKRYKAGTKELTLALLKPAISQIATNSATEKIIDELGEHYANAHYFLLQQACEDYDDASLAEEEAKKASMERAKMILRFVVNACSRSRSFREGLPSNCIGFYRVLLRMRSFEHEVYALLATNAASINKAFAGSREYTTFLGEVCQIFFEAPDPQKGFFFNFFGLLIQDDFAFLANCYAEMEPSVFADLLAICETLTDREISRLRTRMHPNNVEFCVALLQRILSDMGEGKVSELQKKSLVPTLFYTVEILGDLALDAAFYARQLFEKDDAILLMVDFLDAQLHAEAIFEADCLAKPDYPPIPDDPQYDELRKRREEIQRMLARHPDRPEHKPMPKTKRVMNKPELNNLAKFYIERFEKFDTMMGDVKVAILRAIANLSGPCPESQAAVNEDGRWGVISVLQCTARRIELLQDHKLTTQWALIAVRNLVSSCRKNQEIVLNLHEKSSRIIDQAKLLDGLGIQVKRDAETGEMQIVSREMPPGDVPTPNKSDVQPQNPQIPE